jgi:hypothetical protein
MKKSRNHRPTGPRAFVRRMRAEYFTTFSTRPRSGRARLIVCDGHFLHFGVSAPPTVSQISVPGVAIERQLCSNDANVSGRTIIRPIPLNI